MLWKIVLQRLLVPPKKKQALHAGFVYPDCYPREALQVQNVVVLKKIVETR